MPARDIIHQNVKNALVKEGWAITADPYKITYYELTLFADLSAEHPLAAERNGQQIVVEIKSFSTPPFFEEFKNAVGQYTIYRELLAVTVPKRQLYLAIHREVYQSFFRQKAIEFLVKQCQMALVIVDVKREEIIEWKN